MAALSLGGAVLFSVFGWFLRRLVGQIDISIARLQERQDSEEKARAYEDAAIRAGLESTTDRVKDHEAAHMSSGNRLDRQNGDGLGR